MAKKARKKSAARSKKKTRTRKKAKPRSIGDRVSSAYRTVVDTVKGTDRLRNKMEPPGTSETE